MIGHIALLCSPYYGLWYPPLLMFLFTSGPEMTLVHS